MASATPELAKMIQFSVSVRVNAWTMDDGSIRYDWNSSTGERSDETFELVDDAVYDAEARFG